MTKFHFGFQKTEFALDRLTQIQTIADVQKLQIIEFAAVKD